MASWKTTVRAATTNDIALHGKQTIDGVALAAGDRVLVKDQSNPSENGLYTVVAGGAWTRANDADTDAAMDPQMVVRVSEGGLNGGLNDLYGGTEWTLCTAAPIKLGTTALVYVQSDLLKLDRFNQLMNFSATALADGDIFTINNALPDGRSDNPNAYLAASLAGYSNICTGVHGRNGQGSGVTPAFGSGIYGDSDNGYGVFGSSAGYDAIHGESQSSEHAGVSGNNSNGGYGLWGKSDNGVGVYGASTTQDAIQGRSGSSQHAGVSGANSGGGFGVWASSNATGLYAQGTPAGYFNGDVQVTGDLVLINSPASGDVAEDFDLEADPLNAEPGTVLIIGASGRLAACAEPYDTRVAGVVSGAGELRPAVVLQRLNNRRDRSPIALIGKVVCKVDAAFGAIAPGDLLTTSSTPGHAMKAGDRSQALGAILGKALRAHASGRGTIPILVSLR